MIRLTIILLTLAAMTTAAIAQTANRAAGKPTLKTVRLHIDGFSKSKSGAV